MHMELISALEKAASPVPSQRQAGEREIQALEKQSGFHVSLLSIYSNDEVSMSSRYLAIIYLKNAVERKWRSYSIFKAEERDVLRSELIPCIISPVTTGSRQMAKQLAVIIAAIARNDFPRQWPDLLSQINQTVINLANSGDTERLEAVLETMHQTLKKLATARIGLARVQLNEFSCAQIELYWQIFTAFRSYTALKIVGTLLYDGHDRAHRFPGPQNVFRNLFPYLQNSKDDLRLVRRFGKIYERLVEKHPLVFCGFKEDAARVVQFYCDFLSSRPPLSDGGSGPIVQSMCINRDLTRLAKTQDRPETSLPLNMRPRDEADRADLHGAYDLCRSVFTEQTISQIVDALVQYYFQMTAEDVELWQDDPTEFVIEESRQNAEFSVVLCAEMLFAHILKTWPEPVAPHAQNLIEQAVQSGEELKVEGALRALEFGADTFSKSFDIEPIIQLLSSQTQSPLIRRRLCLVVGGWIPVKENEGLQTLAFQLVKSTLEGSWDIVVKLGALELTRICCDDMDFQPQLFPIAEQAVFITIYGFLQDSTQSTEIKLHVLKALGTVIEGLGPRVTTENASKILEILPALWSAETEHSNHHLVQGAVLQTLANLVTACGVSSSSNVDQCYPVSLPLVDVATDPSQPLSTYLLDDALALWKALLVNAPQSATVSLAPLFGRLVTLIENKTEYLGPLLSVLESYLWLDYSLAEPHLVKLFGLFTLYLGDGCSLDEALNILLCTEILVMQASKNHSDDGALVMSLKDTGFLQWMEMCVIKTSNEYGDESISMDVLIEAGKCSNILGILSVQVSGRCFAEPQMLFPAWLGKLRGIADPRDRKLGCMGVSAMLLAMPALFDEYSAQYLETAGIIIEEIPDTSTFSEFYIGAATPLNERLTSEEERQKAARSSEAAVTVGLQAYIKDIAQQLSMYGKPEFGDLAVRMGLITP